MDEGRLSAGGLRPEPGLLVPPSGPFPTRPGRTTAPPASTRVTSTPDGVLAAPPASLGGVWPGRWRRRETLYPPRAAVAR